MPDYKCANVGRDECPVWITLTDKVIIVSVKAPNYLEAIGVPPETSVVKSVVTLVSQGQTIEVKSPLPVESVCRILGFVWDEKDVVHGQGMGKPAPAEPEKTEGGGPS